jgi:hypothetical protein
MVHRDGQGAEFSLFEYDGSDFLFKLGANGNQIGGWNISSNRIHNAGIELHNNGRIRETNGGWRLNSDGSGKLANGNISWDDAGNATITGSLNVTGGTSDLTKLVWAESGLSNGLGGTEGTIVESYSFDSTAVGRGLLRFKIRDPEGGIEVILNGTSYGTPHYNEVGGSNDDTVWLTREVDNLQASNTLEFKRTSSDGVTLYTIEVYGSAQDMAHSNGSAPSGLIRTEYLEADAVTADKINVNDLFAKNITINSSGVIESENYSAGSQGFKLTAGGLFNAYDGTFAGTLQATEGDIGGWTITSTNITTTGSNGEELRLDGGANPNIYFNDGSGDQIWIGNYDFGAASDTSYDVFDFSPIAGSVFVGVDTSNTNPNMKEEYNSSGDNDTGDPSWDVFCSIDVSSKQGDYFEIPGYVDASTTTESEFSHGIGQFVSSSATAIARYEYRFMDGNGNVLSSGTEQIVYNDVESDESNSYNFTFTGNVPSGASTLEVKTYAKSEASSTTYLDFDGNFQRLHASADARTDFDDITIGGVDDFISSKGAQWRDASSGRRVKIQRQGGMLDAYEIRVDGNLVHSSDERLKKNITGIENPMSVLSGIGGYRYNRDGDAQYGLLAQEVYSAGAEDAVQVGGEDKKWGLSYNAMHAFEIEALKDHETRISELEAKLAE